MRKALAWWVNSVLFVITLYLMSCVPPQVANTVPEAVIIVDDSLYEKAGVYAVTLCSWNNKAYVIADDQAIKDTEGEGLVVHEMVHVHQSVSTKGGCWAFVKRYKADTAYRNQKEFEAHCLQGQFLMKRNRDPEAIWNEIRKVMIYRYGVSNPKNCLYEEG